MKRLILWISIALALVLMLPGCVDHNPAAVGTLPVERITPNADIVAVSGYLQPARLVVSDQRTFEKVWALAFANVGSPRPAVDFDHEIVVVAALGGHTTGGFGIEVAGAMSTGHEVVIDVQTTSPGSGCIVTDMPTQPLDIVKIPRSAGAVRFVEHPETLNCQ